MNQVLPLPLASENPFSSEQECIDQIGAHAHHSSFTAGVSDQLRRDSTLGQSATGIPLSSISRGYSSHRPENQYQSGAALSDTGSGSISASPSSNSSSQLGYTSLGPPTFYPQPSLPITNYNPGFYAPMSSTRRTSMMTEPPPSVMLPPTRSPGMGNPVSPGAMGASARDNYTTSTPGLSRHPHALSPRHSDGPRYGSLPETPRSVVTAMPLNTGYSTLSMGGYGSQPERNDGTPPFNSQEDYCSLMCDGSKITPTIDAKIEKGFFLSADNIWTCYRRNYFSVTVHYNLLPWVTNGRLYLDQGNGKSQEQVQSMAVSLAAAVDASVGKTIELVQHTPKRDKGPQLQMKKELLSPMPPGKSHEHGSYGLSTFHQSNPSNGFILPLQNESDSSQAYSPTTHAQNSHQHGFERIQFKSATANNGKRRAQQQYFHLLVELWANIQSPRDNEPRWVKVAARASSPVVVRGRSPSHYSNEGPHNSGASRGAGSGGGPGQGPHGYGANGTQYTTGYRNGLSGGGSSGLGGGGMYRGTTYSLDPSPLGSHSVSSASSLSGGPLEPFVGDHHMAEDEDNKMIQSHSDYQYYPAPIFEAIQPKVESSIPTGLDRRIKEEYPGPSGIGPSWQVGGCGRFQGMETSRGYYPDVHAQHAHAAGY